MQTNCSHHAAMVTDAHYKMQHERRRYEMKNQESITVVEQVISERNAENATLVKDMSFGQKISLLFQAATIVMKLNRDPVKRTLFNKAYELEKTRKQQE